MPALPGIVHLQRHVALCAMWIFRPLHEMDLLRAQPKPADFEPSGFECGWNFNLGQAEYIVIKRGSTFKVLHDDTAMLYLAELHWFSQYR